MSKKDIAILLSPTIIFVILGICAFITSQRVLCYTDIQQEQAHRQKYATFVTNVVTGKWELPPDRWLAVLGSAEQSAAGERAVNRSTGIEVRDFIWFAAIGIYWQVAAVFIVGRRLRKRP